VKKKRRGTIMKLDFEKKNYDKLSCPFLMEVLERKKLSLEMEGVGGTSRDW
jgi:hypothetical protein